MNTPEQKTAADDSDETIEAVRETFKKDVSPALEERLRDSLGTFRRELARHPYVLGRNRYSSGGLWPAVRRFLRPALVAGMGVACLALAAALFLGSTTPTWAQVVETFRSVKSFSATVYIKEDALSAPCQIDLWVGSGGRVRILAGSQVIFAKDGKVTKAFDIRTRSETSPNDYVGPLLKVLGNAREFSLETVLRTFSGELTAVSPVVNADALISQEIVVFDLQAPNTPEWMRIWAMKTSKLPLRIQIWDPRGHGATDVIFAYSKGQPDTFFDPDAFAARLADQYMSEAGLAYLFLKDPVNKELAPPNPADSAAFDIVTTTIDGKPWSLSEYRGKAVLITFWEGGIRESWRAWLQDTYSRFGERDDLVIVGVALDADAAKVRAYCAATGIAWQQLHEPGKRWKNTLARAFGVEECIGGATEVWLVNKDGSIQRLYGAAAQVEGAVLGLTYDSEMWVVTPLVNAVQRKKTVTREQVRQVCGEPDSVDKNGAGEVWHYRRLNSDSTKVKNDSFRFDGSGKLAGLQSTHDILSPAKVTVTMTDEFWKREVEKTLGKYLASKDKYRLELCARWNNRSKSLAGYTNGPEVRPAKGYATNLVAGTYDFSIIVWETGTDGMKVCAELPLASKVTLNKDEKRALVIE